MFFLAKISNAAMEGNWTDQHMILAAKLKLVVVGEVGHLPSPISQSRMRNNDI